MDSTVINTFIFVTFNILETMCSVSPKAKRATLKKNDISLGCISGMLNLTGDVTGTISVSFSEKGILMLASNMFGEELTEVNDELKDVVGEISNMISGQATNKYVQLGKKIKIEAKDVTIGKEHKIEHIGDYPKIFIPCSINDGDMFFEACFKN